MAVNDDYIIAASAGVIVAAAIVLVGFLSRYRRLVQEADKSARLAKDLWESFNSRFSVLDARVIDLMARTEVISSRAVPGTVASRPGPSAVALQNPTGTVASEVGTAPPISMGPARKAFGEGTETETRVLRLLTDGPMTSAQIKELLGKSREHTARLMKTLFDRGLVARNDRAKPFVYELTASGKSYLAS